MGTPEFSVPLLHKLHNDVNNEIVAVYTQPPRPSARGLQLSLSPVHKAALSYNLPVFTPTGFRKSPEAVAELMALSPDWIVVIAYGLILPQSVLDIPRYGCLNAHASLLPRWRGAAPIQHALLAGDKTSGITIMRMNARMDEGPIISLHPLPIEDEDNYTTLSQKLSELAATAMPEVLIRLMDPGQAGVNEQPQPVNGITYAEKISKDQGKIDWNESAVEITRKIKAFGVWPGCWANIAGKRVKLLSAQVVSKTSDAQQNYHPGFIIGPGLTIACGKDTILKVLELQPESRAAMEGEQFVSGYCRKDKN